MGKYETVWREWYRLVARIEEQPSDYVTDGDSRPESGISHCRVIRYGQASFICRWLIIHSTEVGVCNQ